MARLWLGLAAFILLTAAAGVLIYQGISQERTAVAAAVRTVRPLEILNFQAQGDFAMSQASFRSYLLTRDPVYLATYRSSRASLTSGLARARVIAPAGLSRDIVIQQETSQAAFMLAARLQQLPAAPAGDPVMSRLLAQTRAYALKFHSANRREQARLVARSEALIHASERSLHTTVIWSGILAAVAVLLGLLAAFATIGSVTRPLASLTATLRRLASGDHAARAELTGSAETREAALSLNTLADESARLRGREAEANRLQAMARTAGLRIREHLDAEEVLREALAVVEQELDADIAHLHLLSEEDLGLPVGYERYLHMPRRFTRRFPPEGVGLMRDLFRRHASLVVQDATGPEADGLPQVMRENLRQGGIVSYLFTPFGVGDQMLGVIAVGRVTRGRPWSAAEVAAVESFAVDLGRGLHHARLYEAENQLVHDLRALDKAKSDFLATVSHELGAPLASITGYVELLADRCEGPLTPGQERMLSLVDRNTERLRHLIEDVLDLSKIESGVFETAAKPADIAETARSVAAAMEPAAQAAGVSLSFTGPPDELMVNGDPAQLDRAVMNMVSNAVKFTPRGGEVQVHAAADRGHAVVTVQDSGIGISEADQKQLFTRFFRGSNAMSRSIPGTGLGLAIVHTIVANHGGDIQLHSVEGEGTTITMRLPILAPEDSQPHPGHPHE